MSVSRKIAVNTIVQLVGKVITTGSSLVVVALVTRYLGLSTYGDYIAILAYTQFFAIFADLGINTYAVKRLSEEKAEERQGEAGAMVSLRLLSGLIVLGIAAALLPFMPYSPSVKEGVVIMLWAVFAMNANSLFVSMLQAKLEMRYAVFSEIAGRLSVLGFTGAAVFLGYGLPGVVIATTVGNIVNLVLSYAYARRFVSFSITWNARLWKIILRNSLPISITAILSFIYFKVDTLLLSVVPIPGKDSSVEVGVYGSAYKVLELLLLIPTIFLGNVFPILNNYLNSDREKATRLLKKSFDVMALFSFPVTALVFTLATNIMIFIAGPEFGIAALPLRILSFAVLLTYFNGLFTYTALGLSRQRDLIWVYGFAALLNVTANYLLIPHYSYIAAAYVTLVTEVIVLVGAWLVCRPHISFDFSWSKPIRCFIAAVLTAGALSFVAESSLFVTLPFGILLYLSLVNLFRAYNFRELRSLISRS